MVILSDVGRLTLLPACPARVASDTESAAQFTHLSHAYTILPNLSHAYTVLPTGVTN